MVLCFPVNAFSQDTPRSFLNHHKLKPGIYLNYKDFLNSNPSLTTAFTMLPCYSVQGKDSRKDTLIKEYYCQLLDCIKLDKKVFGLFDGTNFYIGSIKDTRLERKQRFIALDYIGRYSFIETIDQKTVDFFPATLSLLPAALLVTAMSGIDDVISNKKMVLFYFNKHGQCLQATQQAINFLLRKDIDFSKEFAAEKKMTNAVYKKYLLKMNERYPL